jgi:hypothetical protein
MWEASSEMTEALRDRKARGGEVWSAWRRLTKGDVARPADRSRKGEPGRTPTEACRRGEQKEVSYRHELNIL